MQKDRTQHIRAFQQLGGGPVKADLTLLHEVRRVSHGEGDIHRLLDQDHCRAAVPQAAHHAQQLLDHHRGQAQRQFVDHQQSRFGQKCHGQGKHLLLATGEVCCRVFEPLAKDGEQGQRFLDPRRPHRLLAPQHPAGGPKVFTY